MKTAALRKAVAIGRRHATRSRGRSLRGRALDQRLRETAIHGLESLPTDKLKVAAQFIIFLEKGISDQATAELLSIPGFLDDIREARAEIAAGKAVPWRKVLRNV